MRRVGVIGVLVALAVLAALAGAGTLAMTETASVRVSMPTLRLESAGTVHGATTGASLVTQRLQVSITESRSGTASLVTVPGKYATGYVEFGYLPCGLGCPNPSPFYRPAGSAVGTADGKIYVLLSAATCFCAGNQQVPVRALNP